ncbi:MAG: GspH/FimT family pseudopilin [Dokdonella sp.]|uniref:GspH/FimT family pseudopilin n=1 Tax=Dokdonella sp. TaxID=2291710 RepID=UPI0025BDFFB5|nr:GspH/FimT family pseudopilin [Dokdonella sp.]MBZ0223777.1 GspH/FimT family pseudopilin [Dokdonella sp.]MCC7254809.1 GspH/FimT family pseudopilin [Dokdonella sp.]
MKSRESEIGNRESQAAFALARCSDSRNPNPDSRPLAHSRARGFTLIELMAVILLLAIAMTIVSISFSKSLQSAKIRAASRDLVAALRYTRGQAIVKGKSQVLVLDLEKNAYTAPGKGARELPKGMVLRLTTAESEVTGGNSGGIRFFPDGSSTGGHIAVLQGQREWRINVAWLTGDIELNERGE